MVTESQDMYVHVRTKRNPENSSEGVGGTKNYPSGGPHTPQEETKSYLAGGIFGHNGDSSVPQGGETYVPDV